MNDRLQRRGGRQIAKWILLSVVVLSHMVIATQLEDTSGIPLAPSTQSVYSDVEDHNYASDPKREDGEPPPASTPPDPADDKGSGDVVVADRDDDGKYAMAITDNAVNPNTSTTESHSENNFSEAFNLKHLIYFENSSQNDGIPSVPTPSHIYNIMEKSESAKLESKLTSQLDNILFNGSRKDEMSSVSPATTEAFLDGVVLKKSEVESESRGGFEPVPIEIETNRDSPTSPEDGSDEEVDSVPMEPTPLSDSDFVTEDPSQIQPIEEGVPSDDAQAQVNATSEEHPIPVFSEWAKQMEKAEKQQEQDVANASTNKNKTADRPRISSPKLRTKNYASPDCGAKIIASNQESDNTGHVLSSSKDEYLISICTSRIWFVVELCEPIQAEKVDLANFELFSSSPKEFSVSVSNRYPTRDWSNVGQFEAKDERTIQNFDLNPQLFGKFVRVDIHSHYNKEHFCPVSLFRVYGTSEFEAFETENLQLPLEDYDDDDEADGKKDVTKPDSNLFKSASDAVFSMVKKAASVLTKGDGKSSHGGQSEHVKQTAHGDNCISPGYVVTCEKCPERMLTEVTDLLSCKKSIVGRLMRWNLVREIIFNTELCSEIMGMNLMKSDERNFLMSFRNPKRDFVAKLFPESYLIAVCNLAGIEEKRMRHVNVSNEGNGEPIVDIVVNNLTLDEPGLMDKIPTNIEPPFREDQPLIFDNQGVVEGIKGNLNEPEPVVEDKKDVVEPVKEDNPLEVSTDSQATENIEIPTQVDRPPDSDEGKAKGEEVTKEIPTGDSWKANDNGMDTNQDPSPPKGHGESVFIRLSNRIKALERNMSLSSQYLEELSRRYKKQVEELQQSFAKTILAFEETSKQTVEEKQQLVDENVRLRRDIEDVLANFFAWKSILFYLCIFVCIQIVLFVLLLLLYIKNRLRERRREKRREEEDRLRHLEDRRISVSDGKGRRNSTEGISVSSRSTTSLSEGKKRPSEEALQIVGTYSELLIETPPREIDTVSATSNSTGNKKKNKSGRNRKSSLPNQVYVSEKKKADSEITSSGNKLMHSSSVNGYSIATGVGEDTNTPAVEDMSNQPIDLILLEENDEFYLPGSDLSYIEFVPENSDTLKTKSSNRRLSSPAFLRTALSKSARGSKKANKKREQAEEDGQSNTSNSSWDWLRRSSSSSQATKSDQLKSLNGSILNNGSASLSSQDSVNPVGIEEVEQSPKKTTKLRKIFKKVF